MGHLKLGIYSFVIDVNELELVSGTPKDFSRDELPDNLKSLYDIIVNNVKPLEKAIFINVVTDNDYLYGGFLTQIFVGSFELLGSDGVLISIVKNNDKIEIEYHVF